MILCLQQNQRVEKQTTETNIYIAARGFSVRPHILTTLKALCRTYGVGVHLFVQGTLVPPQASSSRCLMAVHWGVLGVNVRCSLNQHLYLSCVCVAVRS